MWNKSRVEAEGRTRPKKHRLFTGVFNCWLLLIGSASVSLPCSTPNHQFLCWTFKPEVSLALCVVLKYAATGPAKWNNSISIKCRDRIRSERVEMHIGYQEIPKSKWVYSIDVFFHRELTMFRAAVPFTSQRDNPSSCCSCFLLFLSSNSHSTAFSIQHSLHMFQSWGYKADIAVSAEVISSKFPKIPLWHIQFGSWVSVGNWWSHPLPLCPL